MTKAVFKNQKTGKYYICQDHNFFPVYLDKDYEPEIKVAKNNSEYFVADLDLVLSKTGRPYFVIAKQN